VNSCTKDGKTSVANGKAKVVAGSQNAKLKVSFFGPFYGDYWILDRAEDYSWAIIGEPSGRYLWMLTRQAQPDAATRALIEARVKELGYDWSLVRITDQS
ncbi:MAG: lipocalin family protein, partial [Alteripontixanthobacter sp.]